MNQREPRTGTFLGLPYDFRSPTLARFKQRVWDPDEPKIMVPHVFGWGLTFNLHALLRRLRLIR
ncbi:MAG TPA: hypothetical protein VMM78_03520 [Thermomicrobiales bacterium]|nr:hypothetical protein [Thermomicrobiales bacterium]